MLLVLVASPDDDRFMLVLVSGACGVILAAPFAVGLAVLYGQMAHTRQVPHAHAGVLMENSRRTSVARGPTAVRYRPYDNQDVNLRDLRDQHMADQQDFYTKDRMKVSVAWSVVWGITDVERFLDSAKEPERILCSVSRALLTYHIGKYECKELAPKLDKMADEMTMEAYKRVHRYGIFVASFNLTKVELPSDSPKSPKEGEKEAERIRTIDPAVTHADPRTISHIERLNKTGKSKDGKDGKDDDKKKQQ